MRMCDITMALQGSQIVVGADYFQALFRIETLYLELRYSGPGKGQEELSWHNVLPKEPSLIANSKGKSHVLSINLPKSY